MDTRKLGLNAFKETPAELKAAKEVDESKLANYAAGTQRKSRHAREKEAAEKKRREEEDAAALVYADFIEAFEGESGNGPKSARAGGKTFVRAGGGGPSDNHKYNPLEERKKQEKKPESTKSKKAMFGFDDEEEEEEPPAPMSIPRGPKKTSMPFSPSTEPQVGSSAAAGAPPPKKQRKMDTFLEELKKDQADRENRLARRATAGQSLSALAAFETKAGSHDVGDPLTTNIHVGNLPANINENSLGIFFSKHGDIGSVKIMWPRGEDMSLGGAGAGITGFRKVRSAGLGGFVAFMHRRDAEAAVREMDGFDWGGSILRCGWGKAVPLPPKAIFDANSGSRRERSRSISPGGGNRRRRRDGSRSPTPDRDRRSKRRRSTTHSPDRGRSSRKSRRSYSKSSSRSRSLGPERVWPKINEEEEKCVKAVAGKIQEHGGRFEAMIKDRERDNPKFAFMHDRSLPSYHYFRMLLDREYQAPIAAPPVFDDEGAMSAYSTDSEEESENERIKKGKLGRLAKRRFEQLLRGLTSTREKIARCMIFAIQHADASDEVVDILVHSLMIPTTPIPRKIARLHVISDILHNSSLTSVANVWRYRQAFEARLDEVFDHLNLIYRSFPSRLKAEGFRVAVWRVVENWERWLLFGGGSIEKWASKLIDTTGEAADAPMGDLSESEPEREASQETTSQPNKTAQPSGWSSSFKKASFRPPSEDGDDIDGAPVAADVDGDPVNDVDGDAIDVDVDGEALDGEAMDVVEPSKASPGGRGSKEDDDMFG